MHLEKKLFAIQQIVVPQILVFMGNLQYIQSIAEPQAAIPEWVFWPTRLLYKILVEPTSSVACFQLKCLELSWVSCKYVGPMLLV